ncbi:MAG TPA: DUF5060 domain-containing protein, partial [Chloroflexi bacterium]|nr:DUF5060 domain-containing protein [Chloroflexota bacterium]
MGWDKRGLLILSVLALCLAMSSVAGAASACRSRNGTGVATTGLVLNLADNRASYPEGAVPRYARFELSFDLSVEYLNPYYYYDPEDTPERDPGRRAPFGVDGVSVDAHFVSPCGEVLTVPAFWYRDFRRWRANGREALEPTGEAMWKVRFAPSEVGLYRYWITV